MTFDDHVRQHITGDGSYDIAAAEAARVAELLATPDAIEELARKVASDERSKWETRARDHLRSQFKAGFVQDSLFALDLDALVPLGDSVAVELGDMNEERIRIRKDIRTRVHLREGDAYAREMEFWFAVEAIIPPGGTVRDITAADDR
jgi:hypothetical protein